VLAGGSSAPTAGAAVAEHVLPALDAALDALGDELARLGPGAQRAAEKTRGTVAAALRTLGGKIDAARAHADREAVAAWQRVQRWLLPNGQPQERVYGLATCAARFGERAFLDRVLAAADPDATAVRDLYWSEDTR
jgi:hypothetical protein